MCFSEQVLLSLGQNATVAAYACEYITPMIPGMYFFCQFDLSRRFLTCMNYTTAPMVAQTFSSVVHIGLCYQIAVKWGMEVKGLGIATMITYTSMFVFVTIYSHCTSKISQALFWPTKDTFTGWNSYLAISIPATIMLIANSWAC